VLAKSRFLVVCCISPEVSPNRKALIEFFEIHVVRSFVEQERLVSLDVQAIRQKYSSSVDEKAVMAMFSLRERCFMPFQLQTPQELEHVAQIL